MLGGSKSLIVINETQQLKSVETTVCLKKNEGIFRGFLNYFN